METLDWTSLEPGNSYDMDAQSATKSSSGVGIQYERYHCVAFPFPHASETDVIAAVLTSPLPRLPTM